MKTAVLVLLSALIFFSSCDCSIQTKGVVLDAETGMPLSQVSIGSDLKPGRTVLSDTFGQYHYMVITGGLFRCPSKMKVLFVKPGYKNFTKLIDSYALINDTIRLVRE